MTIFLCLNNGLYFLPPGKAKLQLASMVVCGYMYMFYNRYKDEPQILIFSLQNEKAIVSQTHPYPKHYIITNIYRPPYKTIDEFSLFNAEFDTFASKILGIGYPSYICGDFNINLLKIHTKTHYNTFFEIIMSSGSFQKLHCLLVSVILHVVVRLLTIFLVMS